MGDAEEHEFLSWCSNIHVFLCGRIIFPSRETKVDQQPVAEHETWNPVLVSSTRDGLETLLSEYDERGNSKHTHFSGWLPQVMHLWMKMWGWQIFVWLIYSMDIIRDRRMDEILSPAVEMESSIQRRWELEQILVFGQKGWNCREFPLLCLPNALCRWKDTPAVSGN